MASNAIYFCRVTSRLLIGEYSQKGHNLLFLCAHIILVANARKKLLIERIFSSCEQYIDSLAC